MEERKPRKEKSEPHGRGQSADLSPTDEEMKKKEGDPVGKRHGGGGGASSIKGGVPGGPEKVQPHDMTRRRSADERKTPKRRGKETHAGGTERGSRGFPSQSCRLH